MRWGDQSRFAIQALIRQRFRTAMTLLAMGIGAAAVVMLTGLGDGARLFVVSQFDSLGQRVLAVVPGRNETVGGMPPIAGEGARDMTLEEAWALRRISGVTSTAPMVLGTSEIAYGARSRNMMVVGTTGEFFAIRSLRLEKGELLPDAFGDISQPVCVIGANVRDELFGVQPVLGQWLRLSERRCRVIGVLSSEGTNFGINLSDVVLVPVNYARSLFNVAGLFRILIAFSEGSSEARITRAVEQRFTEWHEVLDVTVISPRAMMASFDKILATLTLAVAGIAAISLMVAGVLVMNVMLINVSQRTAEIGLLKALGATAGDVRRLFLTEASVLSTVGGVTGIAVGLSGLAALRAMFPSIPFGAPLWSVLAAFAISLAVGVVFAWIPAARAAALQPLDALQRKKG